MLVTLQSLSLKEHSQCHHHLLFWSMLQTSYLGIHCYLKQMDRCQQVFIHKKGKKPKTIPKNAKGFLFFSSAFNIDFNFLFYIRQFFFIAPFTTFISLTQHVIFYLCLLLCRLLIAPLFWPAAVGGISGSTLVLRGVLSLLVLCVLVGLYRWRTAAWISYSPP